MSHKHAAVLKAMAEELSVQWRFDPQDYWIKLNYFDVERLNPLTRPELEWRVTPSDQWQADLRQAVRDGHIVMHRVKHYNGTYGKWTESNLNKFREEHSFGDMSPDEYMVVEKPKTITRYVFLSPDMGSEENCFGMNAKVTFPPTGHDILELEILK